MFSDTLCNYSPPGMSCEKINKWKQSDFSALYINIIHLVVAQFASCLANWVIIPLALLAVIYFFFCVTSVCGMCGLTDWSLSLYTENEKKNGTKSTVYCETMKI